jgi:hypothetical protein
MDHPDWQAITAAANDDPETRLALRNARFCAAVGYGEERVLLAADGGTVSVADRSAVADFELRAPATTWEAYAAGRGVQTNSIMSMARQGHLSKDGRVKSEFEFDGDQRKLWANFLALDLVLQQLRRGGA